MTTQIVQNNRENSEFPSPVKSQEGTIFRVLIPVSFCHLLNDTMQSLLPSIYPILKSSFHLNFGQIGLLTLTFQMTASILQPFIGHFTDRKPLPYSLPLGMVYCGATRPTWRGLVFTGGGHGHRGAVAGQRLVQGSPAASSKTACQGG